MQSSSTSHEIQSAEEDVVLAVPNDVKEDYLQPRQMRPPEKLISTEQRFMKILPKILKASSSSFFAKIPSSSTRLETQLSEEDVVLDQAEKEILLRKREMDSLEELIKAEKKFMETLPKKISRHDSEMAEAVAAFEKLKAESGVPELRRMKKLVLQWRKSVASPSNNTNNTHVQNLSFLRNNLREDASDVPEIYQNCSFSTEFEARYAELGVELKLCLLCFAAFPENAEVKRRVLVQWWIGEGFVPPAIRGEEEVVANFKTAECWGDLYFDELIRREFLEPINKMDDMTVNKCRMHPLVRSVVVQLAANAGFFHVDRKGNDTENYPSSVRACFTGNGLENVPDLEKLKTLFNVNETVLTLNPERFSKMKNASVLHLGSWKAAATNHIELLGTKSITKIKYADVLDGLQSVEHLRLLNLERFSKIRKLPRSISKLKYLTILNIKACHNLEFLPNEISQLKNLTHLDMSDCYLLDHMPKGIVDLTKIQVLKGFVVRDKDSKDRCTLADLGKHKELRKLSLCIRMEGFPSTDDLCSLNCFKKLSKLTIAWGEPFKQLIAPKRGSFISRVLNGTLSSSTSTDKDSKLSQKLSSRKIKRTDALSESVPPVHEIRDPTLPQQLEKLELECLPFTTRPGWMRACKLKNLKKLCLRGGNLFNLAKYEDFVGYYDDDVWNVKQLHLKYINNLELEWIELLEQFPKLEYLEKVNCPRMSFFPCDGEGIWTRQL